MKHLLLLSIFVAMFSISTNANATLQSDYEALTAQRTSLVAQDNTLRERRKKLDESGRELQLRWGACAGGRWHVVWTPFEAKLTSALNALGRERKKLITLQTTLLIEENRLDNQRIFLEEKYENNKGSLYESEFRKHMAELKVNFLRPYEEEYLYALAEYLTAYDIWQASARDATNACENSEIGSVIVTAAVQNLDRVLQTLDSIKKFFK